MEYSIVVPIYKDGALAQAFCVEFQAAFRAFLKTEKIDEKVELIFVDDGSPNNSFELLQKLIPEYPFVRVVRLSRNFGQHVATACGYQHASGRIVGNLNVDMEDSPHNIPTIISYMQSKQHDIVISTYGHRHISLGQKITSKCFTWLLNVLSGYKIPLNMGTLRVMNRKFIDAYNSLTEKSRFNVGLEMWLGFNHGYLELPHTKRAVGKSSYSFMRRVRLALEAVLAFSDIPLKLTVMAGFSIFLFGFIWSIAMIIQRLVVVNYQPGYASTVAAITFIGGIQIFVTGIASLYIGRILREVQNRPLFVVEDRVNFSVREQGAP